MISKTLHNRKSHPRPAVIPSRKHGLARLADILYPTAPVPHLDLNRPARQQPDRYRYVSKTVPVTMHDCIGHRLGYHRFNIIQLLHRRVKLGKECRVNIQQPEESKAFDSFAEAFQEKVNAALGVDKKGRALRK